MTDPDEAEDTRNVAAAQLAAVFPRLEHCETLVDRLLNDLCSLDAELRANAAFALGWPGNTRAVVPLIDLLYDPAPEVQLSAVNALANMRDDGLFELMRDRLEHGPKEQKQAILFNLWRFGSRTEEVMTICREYLGHEDRDLRVEAFAILAHLTGREAQG